ncbi:hypothetical protein AAC387_Pa03g4177 [Persea americana]
MLEDKNLLQFPTFLSNQPPETPLHPLPATNHHLDFCPYWFADAGKIYLKILFRYWRYLRRRIFQVVIDLLIILFSI